MNAREIETAAKSCAEMAQRIGARLVLDYWKLRNLGLTDSEIFRLRFKLAMEADFMGPHT